jgi:adenosylcobinamide-GDP ribazoletransferase
LLLKFAALASLSADTLWSAVLLMPLAGRSAMVVHMAVLPYARPEGLARLFYRSRPRLAAIWAVGLLAAVAWGLLQWRGAAVVAGVLLATLVLAMYVRRKIGGATGDTLGAVCELIELVPPLTLSFWPLHATR